MKGCTNHAKKGVLCKMNCAKLKTCKNERCTNQVVSEGVCKRNGAGAKVKRYMPSRRKYQHCCNCKGGVYINIKHGAKVKACTKDDVPKMLSMEEYVKGTKMIEILAAMKDVTTIEEWTSLSETQSQENICTNQVVNVNS